ncbi:MAG: amidohydrolase [Nocardiopsaceae bacterium]|nr:amidohydrolase [Nocardiopsaceae bacterium]
MRTIALEEHFLAADLLPRRQHLTDRGLPPGVGAALRDLGAGRIAAMDEAGIDVQVLSHNVIGDTGPDWAGAWPRFARDANDQLAAAVSAHPDRFAGFATLPMSDPDAAAAEFRRTVTEHGFKGAMINGVTDGRFLDHPDFRPVLRAAADLGVPVYLHPGLPPEPVREAYYSGLGEDANFALATAAWGWHSEVGLHSLRLIMSGVFDELPDLQVIIGHMGEMVPFMLARSDERLTPAAGYLKLGVAEYFHRNFHITTSGFFTMPPFLTALHTVSVDRILFSVDYPYSANSRGRSFLDSLPLSPDEVAKISHRNAEALLGL